MSNAERKVSINGVIYPVDDWDITQYGKNLTTTYGPGGDYDWRAGLGSGYGYSNGFDASGDKLRLAGSLVTLAIPEFTPKHGGFAEVPKPTGTVAFVSATTTKAASGDLSTTHTVASGDDRLLVLGISVDTLAASDYNDETTWPTYGGVRMVLRETSTTGTLGWIFFYLIAPAVGTGVTVTWTNPNDRAAVMTVMNFTGVHQVDPFGNFNEATGSSSPVTVTVAAEFDLVLDLAAIGNQTASVGADQTSRANDIQGTAVRHVMSTQPNTADGVMSWTLGGAVSWKTGGVGILPAVAGTFIYTSEDEFQHKHSYTGTAGTLGAISEVTTPVQNTNGEGAGRPEWWLGTLYVPWGGSFAVQYLATVGATTDTWTAVDFYATELCAFQNGPTGEIAAGAYDVTGGSSNPNPARLATSADTSTPLNASTFAEFGLIGDSTTEISAIRQIGGFIQIAKEEALYEIDTEQFARAVTPILPRGNTDVENGKYTETLGDLVFYPRSDGLWMYYVGREAVQAGVEQLEQLGVLPRVNNTGMGLYNLHDRRPYSPVRCGKWIWFCQATSTVTGATMAARVRQRTDPPGGDLVIHMLYDGDRWKGGFWDSNNHFWMKEATTTPANNGLTVIHTGADGSPNTATRRGNVSQTYTFEFPIVQPDMMRQVQFRAARIMTENWTSECALSLTAFRDNENTATTYGSTITSAGSHVRNPTTAQMAADSDKAYRWGWTLSATNSGSYNPITADPRILWFEVDYRTPQITRYTIPADNERLQAATPDLNYKAAQVALQGLMNYGPVTVLPPDQYGNDAFFGVGSSDEVIRVDERNTRAGRVFDVYVQTWVVD